MKHHLAFPQRNIAFLCKHYCIMIMLLSCCMLMQSCSTTQNPTFYVSAVDDLKREYIGKSKNYIIENFPYPINDIKRLDDQHEILICERYRALGTGITRFYIKGGICYNLETNEYKAEERQVRVSWF